MATRQASSKSEVQCPQVSSSGQCLKVEVADETPGTSVSKVKSSCQIDFSGRKRKREWSSKTEEDLKKNTPGIFYSIPCKGPSCSLHYYEQKKARTWDIDSKGKLPGRPNSDLRLGRSTSTESSEESMEWECYSNSQSEQQEEVAGLAASRVKPRSPPLSWMDNTNMEWCTDTQEELTDKLPGLVDTLLVLNPPQSPAKEEAMEWTSHSQENQPGFTASAPQAQPRLFHQSQAQKRKRESSFLPGKELEKKAPDLNSEQQHPSCTMDTQCGPKMTAKRKRVSLVLLEHHEVFTRMLEDPVIKRFLAWDKELRVSDKYLLSMVIAYFSRAGLFSWQYQRIHFFLALYIACDMEEDHQAPKRSFFPFLYGESSTQRPLFHKLCFQLMKSMQWNLRVSPKECEEIQAYNAGLWVWNRDRTLLPGSPGTMET